MAEKEQLHRLGELLIEEGILTQEELARALEESGKAGTQLASVLMGSSHIRREDLAAFLAKDFSIPKFSLKDFPIDPELAKLVPIEPARKHEMVPLAKLGSIICIGKSNYYNRAAVIELRKLTGLKVKVLLCPENEVTAAIERLYARAAPQPRPVAAAPPVSILQPTPAPPAAVPAPVPRVPSPAPAVQPAAVAQAPTRPQPAAPTPVPAPAAVHAPATIALQDASMLESLVATLGALYPAIQINVENYTALKELVEKRPDQALQAIAASVGPLPAIRIR